MRNKWKFLIFVIVISSCRIGSEKKAITETEIEENKTKNNDEKIDVTECDIRDTVIKKGDFVYQMNKINKREYEISWGDNKFNRTYPEKFACWKSPDEDICDFTPKVDLITKKEIILRVTSATPSAGNCSPIEYRMIYLPREKTEKPFEIEFYLKTENDYAIFSNSFDTISVMNLTTKKVQSFKLNPTPYFEFKTIESSLDSIRIEGKELRFRYLVGTHENYNFTERTIKLKN